MVRCLSWFGFGLAYKVLEFDVMVPVLLILGGGSNRELCIDVAYVVLSPCKLHDAVAVAHSIAPQFSTVRVLSQNVMEGHGKLLNRVKVSGQSARQSQHIMIHATLSRPNNAIFSHSKDILILCSNLVLVAWNVEARRI